MVSKGSPRSSILMRLDVLVKCIRVWIIIFFTDGLVVGRVGVGVVHYLWVWIMKIFFWMRVELPMYSHPADTPPRGGLGAGQAGTIAA